ncbi:MAG TPA: M28 family peptidase [Gemmatimonadales bacterium]
MRIALLGGSLFWFLAAGQAVQSQTDRIRADVSYLADDRLAGRRIGSPGADSAAAYVARRFSALGLKPAPRLGGWLQAFTVSPDAPAAHGSDVGGKTGSNVIGVLPGRDPALAEEYVVIGAHYDHLGLGGRGSLDPDSVGVPHNGADDNASGVAALLEVARRLALTPPARSVLFLAFSGEELGLLGSTYYVKNPVVPNERVVAMFNFDMVGRLRDGKLIADGVETATEFRALLDSLNITARFALTAKGGGYGPSDHTAFTVVNRPVLHFWTGTHEDYHRTTDDSPRINFPGIERIAGFAAELTRAVGNRGAGLTFVESTPPAAPSGSSRTSGYGAYLGTVPDMSDNPGGVQLSGVRAGSPAEKAGLKGGDIIVRIGPHEVPDLQAMTDALRAQAPGDVVDITFRRNGELLTVKVTLGQRGA